MTTIVTRAGKGSPLTHNEVDANFTNLNTDKVEGPALSTDNALVRFDSTTGKIAQNGVNIASDAGEITFPNVASPATPSAGRISLFGTTLAGWDRLGFKTDDGRVYVVQNDMGEFSTYLYLPGTGSGGGVTNLPVSFTGSAAAGTIAVTNMHNLLARGESTAVAATNAVVGLRSNGNFLRVGNDSNAPGGFLTRILWAPATGVSNGSHRALAGMIPTAVPTDVQPSSLLNIVGMGYDAADTNIQMMHNDGAGTATKIDLGASFPKPTADRTEVYELQLFSPNEATQSVGYRVIRHGTTGKTIAAEASGTITTDLPAVTTLLGLRAYCSVGGVSSVVGISVFGFMAATAY